ncbi:hypothetical protein D3C81_287360 [compost metagenome]
MSDPEYQGPEVDNLEEPAVNTTQVKGGKTTKEVVPPTTKVVAEATFSETPDIIGVASLTNAKGDVVTDVLKSRIDRHLQYLKGKKSFATQKEREDEQSSFIESIGGSFQLPYEQFVVVTDYILNVVRGNPEAFAGGQVFRFTPGLDKVYPIDHIRTYKAYMSLLIMISKNWVSRYKLNKLVDVTYAIKDLPTKTAKENVTRYFNQLMVV